MLSNFWHLCLEKLFLFVCFPDDVQQINIYIKRCYNDRYLNWTLETNELKEAEKPWDPVVWPPVYLTVMSSLFLRAWHIDLSWCIIYVCWNKFFVKGSHQPWWEDIGKWIVYHYPHELVPKLNHFYWQKWKPNLLSVRFQLFCYAFLSL